MTRSFKEEVKTLDPALQERLRRTLKISGAWFGFIILGAAAFLASRPYLDRKREERERLPGYVKPRIVKKPHNNI
jgi:hypothetical protein